MFFLWSLCRLQARANRGWSTSASTSAFPATSACLCASTTYQSDCVFAPSPSSKRSGKVVFLGPPLPLPTRKKQKNNTRTKTSFDCFLCAIHLPVNQWSSQPSQSISILPREKRWRQAVTVIAKAHSSLSSCVIPSLVAHLRDYRRKTPFFFFFWYVPLIVFPVTHCCSVIMCNRFCCNECFDLSNKRLLCNFFGGHFFSWKKKEENKDGEDF